MTHEPLAEFREGARSWLADHMRPIDPATPVLRDQPDPLWVAEQRSLQRTLYDGGFAGIAYPRQYGGQGLTRAHQAAFKDEAKHYVLPVMFNVTLGTIAPTLLDFGSEELKARHIPGMLRGDEVWVQFLSEPSGGSDMAAALTRATRQGDTYVINGSKIWSSGAQHADYAMVLCRTDWDAPKHRGLSMIALPIHHPGVTVQPIRLADGTAHFCQEFFDDAVVPATSIVGTENGGWPCALRLLFHERNMVGGTSWDDTPHYGDRSQDGDDLVRLAKSLGLLGNPLVRQHLGEALSLHHVVRHATRRLETALGRDILPPAGASLLKLLHAQVAYRRSRLAFEIAGTSAAISEAGSPASDAGIQFLLSRRHTIEGGSNQMQRNQISERVLGLPRDEVPDRELPFSQARGARGRHPASPNA